MIAIKQVKGFPKNENKMNFLHCLIEHECNILLTFLSMSNFFCKSYLSSSTYSSPSWSAILFSEACMSANRTASMGNGYRSIWQLALLVWKAIRVYELNQAIKSFEFPFSINSL